jgi:hypothetical protein
MSGLEMRVLESGNVICEEDGGEDLLRWKDTDRKAIWRPSVDAKCAVGRPSHNQRGGAYIRFCETNPPFFGDIFVVRDCE